MGYEAKTRASKKDILKFIENIENRRKKEDSLLLLKNFAEITKEKPILWSSGIGNGIIGYGKYNYVSKSGCKGSWMKTGFSPRKSNLVIYIMTGFKKYEEITKKLGKYKTSVSCLYLNKLADVDLEILKQLIAKDYQLMCKKYPS